MKMTAETLTSLNAELSITPNFKWEIGETWRLIFPIEYLTDTVDERGNRIASEELPSVACRKDYYATQLKQNLALGMSEQDAEAKAKQATEEISEQQLIQIYKKNLGLIAFGKVVRAFDNRDGEQIKGEDWFGGQFAVDKDDKDALVNKLAGIANTIQSKREKEIDNMQGLTSDQKSTLKEKLREKKPIRGAKVSLATEVLAYKYALDDSQNPPTSRPDVKSKLMMDNYIYKMSAKKYKTISLFIGAEGKHTKLDYLEVEIYFPTSDKKDPNKAKADSGSTATFQQVGLESNLLRNLNPSMNLDYVQYRKDNPLTEQTIETKVYDFRPMPDADLLRYFKKWFEKYKNYLAPEDNEKFKDTLNLIFEGVTSEDIKQVQEINTQVVEKQAPLNTQTASPNMGMGVQQPTGVQPNNGTQINMPNQPVNGDMQINMPNMPVNGDSSPSEAFWGKTNLNLPQ